MQGLCACLIVGEKMTLKKILPLFVFAWLIAAIDPARALDCGRTSNMAEYTVCTNPQLLWLDRLYNDAFHQRMTEDPHHAALLVAPQRQGSPWCTNTRCLRGAYLRQIGQLYGADRPFDWEGMWWNSTAPSGSSGNILISGYDGQQFHMDGNVKGGVNHSVFAGDVHRYSGVGFTDKINWGGDCAIILVPLADGRLKVSSDSAGSCSLLLPGEMAIDGIYIKGQTDPRPPATLLSIGIFTDRATDDKFRQLVGTDYQQYVDTATDFARGRDLDNIGATVMVLWVKGLANRKAAMIMTSPQGKIWALRLEPADEGKGVKLHYVTTENDKKTLPKTLANWQARFIDR
ncbi:Conserved hypothetical protein [Erwinia tasmaniensis Et1/99]|uniref:Uncharacterized protein n=2 Tax=Erwinia tasmaniensis TaxID=338565 RepID=B2VGE8_ERWT9|nr:Conserved hypothetical protein [Erwinia tasmaniensis Et1/99]